MTPSRVTRVDTLNLRMMILLVCAGRSAPPFKADPARPEKESVCPAPLMGLTPLRSGGLPVPACRSPACSTCPHASAPYIAAFQNAAALERLLRKDATLQVPPPHTWYAGLASWLRSRPSAWTCSRYVSSNPGVNHQNQVTAAHLDDR
jgi:hypothetical protein